MFASVVASLIWNLQVSCWNILVDLWLSGFVLVLVAVNNECGMLLF